jgi:hypothetical protein
MMLVVNFSSNNMRLCALIVGYQTLRMMIRPIGSSPHAIEYRLQLAKDILYCTYEEGETAHRMYSNQAEQGCYIPS